MAMRPMLRSVISPTAYITFPVSLPMPTTLEASDSNDVDDCDANADDSLTDSEEMFVWVIRLFMLAHLEMVGCVLRADCAIACLNYKVPGPVRN